MTETTAIEAAPAEAEPSAERRWSVWRAILAALFLPATTARRTTHLSLATAFAVHVVGVLLIVAIIFGAEPLYGITGPLTVGRILYEFSISLTKFAHEVSAYPGWVWVNIVVISVGIEAFVALLALTIMSWGARDEPLRETYRHSLRTVLLRTVHAALIALCIATVAVSLARRERQWLRVYPPTPPTAPQAGSRVVGGPSVPPPTNQQWADYSREYAEWDAQRRLNEPWYLVQQELVLAHVVMACTAWFLWALLRGVGARHENRPIQRDPMCDTCGYNLLTISMDSRCPECGDAVQHSLGPDARPGTSWQRRRLIGRWQAWWDAAWTAPHRPDALGRRIRLFSPGKDHSVFLSLHLPVVFLIGAATPLSLYAIDEGMNPFVTAPEFAFVAGPMTGYAACFFTIGLSLLSASVIGCVYSLREKRNLLSGAVQVSCYLSAFFTAWVLFAGANMIATVFFEKEGWADAVETLTGVNRILVTALSWLMPNCIIGLWYLTRVAKSTAATRYANR